LCSAISAFVLFGAAAAAAIPLPWVLALGITQAGIMWWQEPWAVGSFLGMTASAMLVYHLPWALGIVAGLGLTVHGIVPAALFARRRLPYDMSREIALNTFLLHGVLINALLSALAVAFVGWTTGRIESAGWFVSVALLWLVHSVSSLVLTLPILRFGTHALALRGIFGTPAALQRGIFTPTITRKDLSRLALMLGVVVLLSWGVQQTSYVPPQFINVLFLLPIVALTAMRGFDGALLSATSSLLLALLFVLEPINSAGGDLGNQRVLLASLVFELAVYYLISIVGGLLIDAQRSERRRMTTLLDLSSLFTSSAERNVVSDFAERVRQSTYASASVVANYNRETNQLEPISWIQDTPPHPMLTQPLSLRPYPAFVRAIEQGKVLVLHSDDPQPRTSTSAFWATTGFTTCVLVPLRGTEQVIGIVGVFDLRPERVFAINEVRLIEAMCAQAAAAFEQRRLIGALRDHTEQLSAVAQITAVLNATLDLDVVCRRIARQIARVVPHDWACVALTTEDKGRFRIVMSTGNTTIPLADDEPFDLAPETLEMIAGADAVPVRLDLRSHPAERGASLRKANMAAVLLVPLRREDRWLGILVLASHSQEAFPETQQYLLQMLSRHMALAISNATLYAELEQTYRAKQEAQDVLLQTERLRALGELSSGIAHDFNNVLAGILGHTQLLLMDATDQNREGLKVIEQAARDGTQMVHRIQQFARVRQAKNHDLLDINAIVDDVMQLTRPRWRNRNNGIVIKTEIDSADVPEIYGSDFALREVLTNLVLNAIDAMPTGGTLTIRTRAEPDGVSIQVADTGIGMSEATQAHMWDPFFSTKGEQGTGLGLTMAHAIIVQHHGGRILVQSTEHVGTTITMILPARRDGVAPSDEPVGLAAAHNYQGRILIAESDVRVRQAISGLLESAGHQVVVAESGLATLAEFEHECFDVIVADSALTDMSVWDLVTQLKEACPHLKAVLLTVWTTTPEADQRRQIFDAVLPKPFESSAVQAVIAELLAGKPTEEPA
jgi:signal transduction histidine kinase/CheY-like chemotaxis protein